MKFIESTLKTFYNCCNLPICVLDNNFLVLSKYGYTEEIDKTITSLNVLQDIEKPLKNLNYNNNISFLTVPFILNEITPLLFLIGPFNNNKNLDTNLRTLHRDSYKYIENLLTSILDDKHISSLHPCVSRTISYVHNNYSNAIYIDDICDELNINKCYFCILFKKETGYTFTQFLTLMRIERSKRFLKNSSLSLMEIALNVGFSNQCYYSTTFKKITGKTPSEYRACI